MSENISKAEMVTGVTSGPISVAPPPTTSFPMPLTNKGVRLWPGVLIVIVQLLLITIPGWVAPGTMTQFILMFWSPMISFVALLLWWLIASRVRWYDRLLMVGVFAVAAGAAGFLAHPSYIFGLFMYGLPTATTAWVLWLAISGFLPWSVRRVGMVAAVLLVAGYCTMLRLDGVTGGMDAEVSWRWRPTAEDHYLAETAGERSQTPAGIQAPAEEKLALQEGDWPEFRGPKRDGRLTGVRIATNWNEKAPVQLWKRLVGPGWSSFAVVGKNLYTQEQRGEKEVVVCYDTETGSPRWVHEDDIRFYETVAGPGPRATPTFHEGKIYALGAKGLLNCLDAVTGKLLWSKDIVADSGAKVPTWGFSASPLVAHGIVTVFAGGPEGKSVLGYQADSGKLAWSAGEAKDSYCSTQLATFGGVEQILVTSGTGLTSYEPATGKVLWEHSWPMQKDMARVIQPAIVDDSDVLLGTGFGSGTRRIHLQAKADGWSDEELWTTTAISPYYNDLVVHKGHLYGFDGIFFTCVELAKGESKWRARGYGNGQVLLLADQGVLLVVSEKGEVALLEANPEKHVVLGKFKAIKGKTWNHPVIAHGKLFVRNGEEMACYQLTPAP